MSAHLEHLPQAMTSLLKEKFSYSFQQTDNRFIRSRYLLGTVEMKRLVSPTGECPKLGMIPRYRDKIPSDLEAGQETVL
jgi:hypothetical protein